MAILCASCNLPAGEAPAAPSAEIPRIEAADGLDPRFLATVEQAIASVERDRTSADRWGRLGRVYHSHKYFTLARQCYETAHRLDPSTAAWPYYLGSFASGRGQTRAALDLLQQALRLDPTYLPSRLRIGNLLLIDGRLDEAERVFRELTSRAPDGPWGYLGRGKIARREGRLREAVELFEQALSRAPEDRENTYLLGLTYRKLGRSREGEEHLEGVEERSRNWPSDPLMELIRDGRRDLQSLIIEANKRLEEGQAERAEVLYLAVLDDDPDNFDAHHNLGVLYGRLGRLDEARNHLEKAVRLRTGSATAHFGLATALVAMREFDRAQDELEIVLELDPNHPEARSALAGKPPP